MKTIQSIQGLLSKKALLIGVFIFALAFITGCKKTNKPNQNNVDENGVVNPTYVSIDWDNVTLLSANDSIGDYQIQFSEEMPELQPGSIITIDQDTVVHHIFIETVNVNGNTVSVTSTEAYLTDIFSDTDFTLSTAEGNRSSAKGKVFYPTEVYLQDEYGTYKKLDMTKLRDGGFGFTHNLWHFGENFDGEVLSSGDNYKLYMEKLNFDFDIDLEMYMNFSGRDVHEIVGNAIDRYRSKALNIKAYLFGNFYTEQKVRCDIWGSGSWNPGYDIWKHNLFRPFTVKFLVYGVPVVIKVNSDLYRQVQVTATGEISAYSGFTDHAEGRLGFEWHQSSGMSPIASFSNTFDFTPPTVEGRGAVEARAWAFPRIRLLLYSLAGPSFDIKPYLATKVKGGFKEEMLGMTNDFCAWSLDCNTGMDACCGLSLQFMGYEVENYSTPNWNIFEKTLYHSPKKVLHSSKSDGQKRTVSFNVYDQNYLFNTEVLTPLPQFVKFEANGQLSAEYGIAHNGQVLVNWTPTDNDILYAKLFDINGNVMAWDTVNASNNLPSITTVQVTNITQNSAMGGGIVTNEGESPVIERGICWSTNHNPTISDNHSTSGMGIGSFTVNMTGLTSSTTYYVRAYATNQMDTYYGNEVSFTTEQQENGDWVDLGLPSGLLWATRNVEAYSPEGFGYYFAWAETQQKSYYDWDTYRYWNGAVTKYNGSDGLTILQPNDDAATVHLGNGCRIPTYDDWNELMTHCTQTYTTLDGVKGIRFIASNGNSIFLPAAGFRHLDGVYVGGQYDGYGFYWSSSRSENNPNNAWYVRFYEFETPVLRDFLRLFGLSIRPVRSPN